MVDCWLNPRWRWQRLQQHETNILAELRWTLRLLLADGWLVQLHLDWIHCLLARSCVCMCMYVIYIYIIIYVRVYDMYFLAYLTHWLQYCLLGYWPWLAPNSWYFSAVGFRILSEVVYLSVLLTRVCKVKGEVASLVWDGRVVMVLDCDEASDVRFGGDV